MMTTAMDVACPRCAAQPAEACRWDSKSDAAFHAERIEAAAFLQGLLNEEAGVRPVGRDDFEAAVDADDEV